MGQLRQEDKIHISDESTQLLDILEGPWFTRVWVFQELLLSRDPWLQCGSQRIRWGELHNLFRHKKNKWKSYTVNPQQVRCFHNFLE